MRISLPIGLTTRVDKFFLTNATGTLAVFGTTALLLVAVAPPANAQCTTDGGTEYSSILSTACESCTSSCDRLGAAGADCGASVTCRLNPGRLADFVFGDPCDCGGLGGGCGLCGGSGCGGNFWNNLCSGGGGKLASSLTSFLFGDDCDDGGSSDADFGDSGPGCGLVSRGLSAGHHGWLRLCGSGCGCDGEPGAGYVGQRESPIFCGMPAPTYPVPYAVPQHVGYTQFTYPPFMPHHSLPHYRHTYSYRHAPGMSRTTVHWGSPVGRDILAKLHHMIELPR